MESEALVSVDQVRSIVTRTLGSPRVKEVDCVFEKNSDGLPVARITVVYRADQGLTVDDMDGVFEALWSVSHGDEAPFPVIDFREDSDGEPIAAE